MDELARDLDIPFKRNGSLVVCTKDQDRSGLENFWKRNCQRRAGSPHHRT